MPLSPQRLVETTPPGAEPVTLDDIKTHLRVDHASDDTLVSNLIAAARGACESFIGRALITRSYSLYLDEWPAGDDHGWWDGLREGANIRARASILSLPRPPLISVTHIYTYAADNTQSEYAAANYYVDTASLPGRIVLKDGAATPSSTRVVNGIEIQFSAGYGATPQSVPAPLRQGLRQMIAHLYQNRGDDTTMALSASGAALLFQPYRLASLA